MIDFSSFFENNHIELYDLQKEAITEAIIKKYFLVVGEQGSGKTEIGAFISKIVLQLNSVEKVLIVTKREILDKFKSKLLMYIPELVDPDIKVMNSNEERNIFDFDAKIYICDYNQIKLAYYYYADGKSRNTKCVFPIDERWCVIFDEIQAVKTIKSQVHKICYHNTKKAKYRIGLSGTPIEKIEDLFSIFRILDPSIINIEYYYFMQTIAKIDPFTHRLLFYKESGVKKIRERINPYIKIFKKEQIKKVVNKNVIDVSCDFTTKFREEYNLKVASLLYFIDSKGYVNKKEIANIIQPLYNKVKEVSEDNPRFVKFFNLVKRITHTEKLIIWERSPEIIESLSSYFASKGIKNIFIYGDIKKDIRADIINKFNEDNEIKVLIISFLTSAEAWEIPSRKDCKRMIFYSLPDRIISYQQCIDRLHRLTSQEDVTIYRMILNNSIDEWAKWLLEYKQSLRDNIIDNMNYNTIELDSLRKHLGDYQRVLGNT